MLCLETLLRYLIASTGVSPKERCFHQDDMGNVELAANRCMATSIGGLSMEHKSELVGETV